MEHSLIELGAESFKKIKGNRGHVLGLVNAQNLTLVMFYSMQCTFCDQAMPELAKLSRFLRENNMPVQVAVCDVSKNKRVIQESADTVDPIKYVPYLTIYLGDPPYLRYNGKKVAEMLNYLVEVNASIPASSSSSRSASSRRRRSPPAPPVRIPYNVVCEGDVCYLTQDEVFGGKPKKKVCVGNVCYLTQEEVTAPR
jgi:thiol-disulfide isomerase/thioredoxin